MDVCKLRFLVNSYQRFQPIFGLIEFVQCKFIFEKGDSDLFPNCCCQPTSMARNCKFEPLYQYDFFIKVVPNCVFYTLLENYDNPTVTSFSIKFLLRLGHVSPSTFELIS